MYMPLVPVMWENIQGLTEIQDAEATKELLVSLLYIISYLGRILSKFFLHLFCVSPLLFLGVSASIRHWTKSIPQEHVAGWFQRFTTLFALILRQFEYRGSTENSQKDDSKSESRSKMSTILCENVLAASSRFQNLRALDSLTNSLQSQSNPAHASKKGSLRERRAAKQKIKGSWKSLDKVEAEGSMRERGHEDGSFTGGNIILEWERTFAAQVTLAVLDYVLDVLVPIAHRFMLVTPGMQSTLFSFFRKMLGANQSQRVLRRLFNVLGALLRRYSHLVWHSSARQLLVRILIAERLVLNLTIFC